MPNTLRDSSGMKNRLIYDVGMNNGDDTAYYLWKGYSVIAIEADPLLVFEAEKRFEREINDGRLNILNIGISSKAGDLDFWICETNSAWNSFHQSIASRDGSPHHKIIVPCHNFSWVLEKYGVPFYLKIDIEGNDLLCIDALVDVKEGPKYLSIEGGSIYVDMIDKLVALGYNEFKCISQRNFLPIQMPYASVTKHYALIDWLLSSNDWKARTARTCIGNAGQKWMQSKISSFAFKDGWQFNFGSSGPFGEDTQGNWLNADSVKSSMAYFFDLLERKAPSPFWNEKRYGLWFDIHARRDY